MDSDVQESSAAGSSSSAPVSAAKQSSLQLLAAAQAGAIANVRRLLAKDAVDVNERDERLFTPLIWAAANNKPKVVDALVKAPGDKKADLNARAATGDGALHWACWHGDVSTVWLLLAHGAIPSTPGETGMLPLHYAATGNHMDVVDALLQFGGVDLSATNDYGNTADMLATDAAVKRVITTAAKAKACTVCDEPFHRTRPRHQCHYCTTQVCAKDSRMKDPDEEGQVSTMRVCKNCTDRDKEETARRKQEEEERQRQAKMNASSMFTSKITEALREMPSEEAVQGLLMSRMDMSGTGAPTADFVIPPAVRELLPVRPPGSWVTVPVYVCSAYPDMHSEREYLNQFVFPALRHFLRMRRVHLLPVDLHCNWNVPDEDDPKTLELMFEFIDKCRPLSVTLLGERYGHTPPSYELSAMDKFEWVMEIESGSLSLTDLEVKYGVLDNLAQALGFFYLRDAKFMQQSKFRSIMPPDLKDIFAAEADNNKLKLKSLKDDVLAQINSQQVFNNYPCDYDHIDEFDRPTLCGLEEVGRRVFTDLWTALDVAYPMRETGERFVVQRAAHQTYAEHICRNFYGRKKYLQALTEYASQTEIPEGEGLPVLVTGDPGTGKTALLGEFAREFTMNAPAGENTFVFFHFAGVAVGSCDSRELLLRICQEMVAHFNLGVPSVLLRRQNFWTLRRTFKRLLRDAAAKGLVVLVLDGMDRMSVEDLEPVMPTGELAPSFQDCMLDWIPEDLPTRVRVVLSSSPSGEKAEWLSQRYNRSQIILGTLDESECKEIIQSYVTEFGPELEPSQAQVITRKQEASKPLYLALVAEELHKVPPNQWTALLKELPGTIEHVLSGIIEHLEDVHGRKLIEACLTSIVCARIGLHEIDVMGVVGWATSEDGEPMPFAQWARIQFALLEMLRPEAGDIGVAFYHKQMDECIRRRYLDTPEHVANAHKLLAAHFRRSADPANDKTWMSNYNIALVELPFHLEEAQMYNDLQGVMCDLSYLERRCLVQSVPDVTKWYRRMLQRPAFSDEFFVKTFQRFATDWSSSSRSTAQRSPQLRQLMDAICPVIETYGYEAQFSLSQARQALQSLTELEIKELASHKKPHSSLLHIMECVQLCKGARSTTWKAAKSALQSPSYVQDVLYVDVTQLKEKSVAKANKLMEHHAFNQYEVKFKSNAAAIFLQWVTAILHQHKRYQEHEDAEKRNEKMSEAERQERLADIKSAVKAILEVSKGAVAELKATAEPPDLVKTVMAGVVTLFGGDRPSWQESRARLADPNFIPMLVHFDRDGVKRPTIQRLEQLLAETPDFVPDTVAAVNHGRIMGPICAWVLAMGRYGRLLLGPDKVAEKGRRKGKGKGKKKAAAAK